MAASTSTINSAELARCEDTLAKNWWSPGMMENMRPLNDQVRVPFIVENIDTKSGAKQRVLDLGCGGGVLTEALATVLMAMGLTKDTLSITGIDPGKEAIEVAKGHLPPEFKEIVSYHCETIEDFVGKKENAQSFDTVVMAEVIEHVDNPKLFLKNAVAATKPGGTIVVTTPAKTLLLRVMLFYYNIYTRLGFGHSHGHSHGSGQSNEGGHGHSHDQGHGHSHDQGHGHSHDQGHEHSHDQVKGHGHSHSHAGAPPFDMFISVDEAKEMFKENNCTVIDVKGYARNPITGNWWTGSLFSYFRYAVIAVKNKE